MQFFGFIISKIFLPPQRPSFSTIPCVVAQYADGSTLASRCAGLIAAALTCILFLTTNTGQAQQYQDLPLKMVHPTVADGKAVSIGAVPPAQRMKLHIVLPLRNQAELDTLLQEQADPASRHFRHWLTVEEFTERFGPTESDYQAVIDFAKNNGFNVIGKTARNRLVVSIEGSVDTINKALHVQMTNYQHPEENRTFYSPDREPLLDLKVPVRYIDGLSNYALPHSIDLKKSTANPAEKTIQFNTTGSGTQGTFLGSDMRAAYYGENQLTGAGQYIGIYGGQYNMSDVELYFSNNNQSFDPSSVQNVSVDGFDFNCSDPTNCDDGEEVIDIVRAISMAPEAKIIEFAGGCDLGTLQAMSTNNPLTMQNTKSISCYDPSDPEYPTKLEGVLEEMVSQGQTLFTCSGDHGAYPPTTTPGYDPAESTWTTVAGGTDLTTNGAGGSYITESAWVGSGGGPNSYMIPIPSWQLLPGVINASNGGSTQYRNQPDVAAEANMDNYFCASGTCPTIPNQNGVYYIMGGTSLSAPMWAGYLALANQQAATYGQPLVGNLNPAVYAIGTGANYDNDFHDVVGGNNNNGQGQSYTAVTGYDLVTGWGSPNGPNLINDLVGYGFQLANSAPSGGLNINPLAPGTATITVNDINGFSGNVTLSVSGLPAGVTATFSPNSTTGTSTLTLTASPAAAVGAYNVIVTGTSGLITAVTYIPVTVTSYFTLSASPASVSVIQGTATSTIMVNGQNGFNGSINLSLSGQPDGVTGAFSPNPTTENSVLTLTVSNTAAPGIYNLTITGNSPGAPTATTQLALTITPSFTLSASPSSVSVKQSLTGTSIITVTDKNGYGGGVNLSLSGLPSGVNWVFSPNPTTGKSVLTLTVSSSAHVGTYPLTITGVGTGMLGIPTATTPLTLTIISGYGCHVAYSVTSQWLNGGGTPDGFNAGISITNTGILPFTSWDLTWSFANGQKYLNGWNGNFSQYGASVSATNMSYNSSIPVGVSATGIGFAGTWNGMTNAVPTSFAVNGTPCN
ncbi:MAG: protease pro-enzyme activation domain-containing protein [Terracidiphilus sp.]